MKAYVIAGEPSGDRLGAALMQGLKSQVPAIQFDGIAGDLMQAEGMQSLFDMSELSVMGLVEILPKYCSLKRRIRETADDIIAKAPDVLITIDAPDFSFRVARLVKERSTIRTVHYVAPTVWAWRPGRAKKMARFIDHVLTLFPFEPRFMTKAGMDCDFVGHPVVSEPKANKAEIAEFAATHKIVNKKKLVLLPGSRTGEVRRLLPIFRQVLEHPDFKNVAVILPTLPRLAETVRELLDGVAQHLIILDGQGQSPAVATQQRRVAMAAGDAALAASGTVSLELAAANTPMVIAYRMNWLTWQIVSRMMQVDTATLVNLVTDTREVPEFLGPECTANNIAPTISRILSGDHQQTPILSQTMQLLGQGGEAAGVRAAKAILSGL